MNHTPGGGRPVARGARATAPDLPSTYASARILREILGQPAALRRAERIAVQRARAERGFPERPATPRRTKPKPAKPAPVPAFEQLELT